MLLLSRKDVESVFGIREGLEAVRQAVAELASGRAIMPQRLGIPVSEHNGQYLAMPGYLPGLGYAATKLVTVYGDNPAKYNLPTIIGTVLLTDATNGMPVCFMEGTYLTAIRTGAIAGVAADVLARKNARVVSVIGAGVEGRTNLEAVCAVRDVEKARVFDIDENRRGRFAEEMSKKLGVPVQPVGSSREAVEGADIVLCATTSPVPVVLGEWVAPGTHLSSIGSHVPDRRELDTAAIKRASKVVVDGREAVLSEAGDLIIPIQEGSFTADQIHGELGDVVIGKVPGRTDEVEITVFKSVGLAAMDVAAAAMTYNRAKQAGVGTEVNLF